MVGEGLVQVLLLKAEVWYAAIVVYTVGGMLWFTFPSSKGELQYALIIIYTLGGYGIGSPCDKGKTVCCNGCVYCRSA
jgi:hypothetical protein